MPLPSQYTRPSSRRSHMYRRRVSPLVRALVVVLIVLGVGMIIWAMWPGESTEAPDATLAAADQDTTAPPNEPVDTAAVTTPLPTPEPERSPAAAAAQPSPAPDDEEVDDQRDDTEAARPSPALAAPEPAVTIAELPAQPEADVPDAPATREETTATTTPDNDTAARPAEARPTARESSRRAVMRKEAGLELLRENRIVEAREMLTAALATPGVSERDAEELRTRLSEINEVLVFSPQVVRGDPFAKSYTVESNDSLAKIRKKNDLAIDWRFLQRINGLTNPNSIQVGQSLKLITGPFHAVVHKTTYRMDIFLGDGTQRVYVTSLPVGLGEFNSTPEGLFKLKKDSKLINPAWRNPRTGEPFTGDDPMNPIGEHWIGLEGLSENIKGLHGYGIHGTIDMESIGKQESMGCVRLLPEDVELVYELLTEHGTLVEIRAD